MVDEKKTDEARAKVEKAAKGKPKQLMIPGTEERRFSDVEKAIDLYCEARDARMAAGKIETEMKDKLVAVMKKRGLARTYKRGPFSCEIEAKETVKARNSAEAKNE
jgi:hypothetical protein